MAGESKAAMNREDDNMERLKLERLLDAVRRRLLARRVFTLTSRNLLVALLLVTPPTMLAAVHSSTQGPAAAAVLCGLAVLAGAVQAALRRVGRFDAALYLDRRLRLQERLSTLLSPAAQGPDAICEAFRADALRHSEGISAAAACPLSIPRSAPFTGVALFCAAALIFGVSQNGDAGRPQLARDEVGAILSSATKTHVQVELSPEMQKVLDGIPKPPGNDLDAAASRVDDLLAQFDALQGIKKSAPALDQDALTAEDMKKMIEAAPDARTRLEETLSRAAEQLQADNDLRKLAEEALAALENGSAQALAESLQKLITELSAKTARQQFDKLKALKNELSALRKTAEKQEGFENGVTRVLIAGGKRSDDAAVDPSVPLFPRDAEIRAKSAAESGKVPARYRWVVEKYFAEGAAGGGN